MSNPTPLNVETAAQFSGGATLVVALTSGHRLKITKPSRMSDLADRVSRAHQRAGGGAYVPVHVTSDLRGWLGAEDPSPGRVEEAVRLCHLDGLIADELLRAEALSSLSPQQRRLVPAARKTAQTTKPPITASAARFGHKCPVPKCTRWPETRRQYWPPSMACRRSSSMPSSRGTCCWMLPVSTVMPRPNSTSPRPWSA